MNRPEVSVVMSVYNGASTLTKSIDSILCQEGVEFEFIIVNDGSTDGSSRLLEQYAAKDARIRVIHQENAGLTKALIRGCAEARGKFIARQDVGDCSLPGRLAKELALIQADPATVLVSCGTRFVGPKQEPLFDVVQTPEEAMLGLRALNARQLRGPSCHPCTLFRTDAYRSVGGYRQQFRMAQDIDLWVRLAEWGNHVVVPEILYQAECSLQGISAGRQGTRLRINEMIVKGSGLRRIGLTDESLLEAIQELTEKGRYSKPKRGEIAYFIGALLFKRASPGTKDYLAMALRENPLHLRAWIRYLQTLARSP